MTYVHQRRIAAACCVALMLSVSACGDDDGIAPGGQTGFAGAIVTDDPTATSPSLTGPVFAVSGASEAALYSGSITGDLSVAVSADGTTWIELGPPQTVSLAAQALGTTAIHTEASMPVGSYNRIRLTLRNASVEVLAGSTIGGVTIAADVEVSVGGGGEIEIVTMVPTFNVSADADVRTEVLLDLNSELWITEDAVQSGVATEADIEAAVEGDVRTVDREA